jgi:thiol-disulfide isomerase/thioredoxin
LPLYEALRAEFPQTDFEILAVNVDEDLDSAQRFLARHPVSYMLVHDDGSIASSYAPPTMPTSYLVDRNGQVVARHLGFRPTDLDKVRVQIRYLIEADDAH